MKKQVLVVEDEKRWHNKWSQALEGKDVILINAFSIKEAEQEFNANPDIAAIVMDDCVPGDYPTTIPLVKKFREVFKSPIIAVSISKTYRQWLIQAGCDYEAKKDELPEKLLEILGM